jgi:hypothetical protein
MSEEDKKCFLVTTTEKVSYKWYVHANSIEEVWTGDWDDDHDVLDEECVERISIDSVEEMKEDEEF